MNFDSIEQLEKYILDKCKIAVANAEQEVHRAIDKFLKKYYSDFEPKEYIRTEQLLHSLVKTGVKSTGNGYMAEVYFDVGALNYETGYMYLRHTDEHGMLGYATWDGGKVLETAMQGSHGGYTYTEPIWAGSMVELWSKHGSIIKLLVKELKAAGIPIH